MKMAICGAGRFGLEAALYFQSMDVPVKIFEKNKWGGFYAFLAEQFPHMTLGHYWRDLTSVLGREVLSLSCDLADSPSSLQYYESYLMPLIEKLKEQQCFAQVNRIGKSMGSTCIDDPFELIYQFGQEIQIDMAEGHREVFEKPHYSVESYEQFDVIIEATGGPDSNCTIGPFGMDILNESHHRGQSFLHYGVDAFEVVEHDFATKKHITIVGDHTLAGLCLVKAWEKVKSRHRQLEVLFVSGQHQFFESLIKSVHPLEKEVARQVVGILNEVTEQLEVDVLNFKKQGNDTPMPLIQKLCGYQLFEIDTLVDQARPFVGLKRLEEGRNPIICRQTDAIYVFSPRKIITSLVHGQMAFNWPQWKGKNEGHYYLTDIEHLPAIEDDLLRYFRRK